MRALPGLARACTWIMTSGWTRLWKKALYQLSTYRRRWRGVWDSIFHRHQQNTKRWNALLLRSRFFFIFINITTCALAHFTFSGSSWCPISILKEKLEIWKICLCTFLQRVRWEDQYHPHFCLLYIKLKFCSSGLHCFLECFFYAFQVYNWRVH